MRIFIILGILLTLSQSVLAFPKYTTRENAIRLAKVIDKATFKHYKVASVFVKNRSEKEYYLQVILEDGSKHDWHLDQIYEWTLTDQIHFTRNRVVVFPSNESTEFHVFDKNAFYRLVLNSKAFVKTYPEHDLLASRSLKFTIRRFQLMNLEKEGKPATDRFGNRYRYILDLQNGSREVLTYLDAYELVHRGAFIQQPTEDDIILSRAFQVESIHTLDKKLEDELRNIWSFGVEVKFKQPIPLGAHMFPFQIKEETDRDPRTGERNTRFYVQVAFPNTEKTHEIPELRTVEYLQHVQIVTDLKQQKRVFLRAQISPEVFELPPYIEVTGENSIVIHFFLVTDQSVAKRVEFARQDVLTASVPDLEKQSNYDRHYLEAVEYIRSVKGFHRLHQKIGAYLQALTALHNAAMHAKTDQQIAQAFEQRDVLEDILPKMILENTEEQLHHREKDVSTSELEEHLQVAEQLTSNREVLRQITALRDRL